MHHLQQHLRPKWQTEKCPPSLRKSEMEAEKNQAERGESLTDLQADCQVDPAAKGGADSSRVESQVLEEFGEGLRQGYPGTLLRYNHAGPHPRQVQASRLKGDKKAESEKLSDDISRASEGFLLANITFSKSVCRPRPLVQSSMTL